MASNAPKPQLETTSHEWQRVRELLADALELPAEKRAAYVQRVAGDDAAMSRYLLELIAAHESPAAADLDIPPVLSSSAANSQNEATLTLLGRRIGPYRVESEIARGGMGIVLRAVRADDVYQKQVAIKVVSCAAFSSHAAELFRRERQVLANLEHPNIARLLDGGTTEDGSPYLVMEYVEGEPVTAYCETHQLGINERLRLFQKVCAAVQYAHQNLVIHRDIKPANILVTEEGEPKLLDFGIAKIIDLDGGANATATAWQALTPAYASPEQLLGELVTTSTDVYSLGLVLYELLSGMNPFSSMQSSPLRLQKAILEEDPELASKAVLREHNSNREQLADQLKGDLDSIVSKAIRKNRTERYSSVEQLAGDVRRHLENLPVLARPDTWHYRTVKFTRRHRTGMIAGALVFASLLTGIVLTAYEAHIARAERQRAERHFNDVRKLANSLIFEFHDSIQGLPGATPARKLLLERALDYLDTLARESSGDVSLQRDLATAYQRVGVLQGNAHEANTGETAAGIVSLQKAVTLQESVAKANPNSLEDQLSAAQAHRALANILGNTSAAGARQQTERAIAITERLLQANGSNPKVLAEQAAAYDQLAFFQDDAGDAAGSTETLQKSVAIVEGLLKSNAQDVKLENRVAIGRVRLGNELSVIGHRKEALDFNRSGLDLYQVLTQDQTNAKARREMAVTLVFRGDILMQDGDARSALELFRRSLAILESLQNTDPNNVLYRLDVAGASAAVGRAMAVTGQRTQGIVLLERATKLYEERFASDHSYTDIPYWLGLAHVWSGAVLEISDLPSALENYQKSARYLEGLMRPPISPSKQCDLATIYSKTGTTLARMGRLDEALREYQKALRISEPLAASNVLARYALAENYFGMGDLSERVAVEPGLTVTGRREHLTEAHNWYGKSEEAWKQIPNPGHETPNGIPVNGPSQVAQRLHGVESALAKLD